MRSRLFVNILFAMLLASCVNMGPEPSGEDVKTPTLDVAEPVGSEGSLEVTFEASLSGGITKEECGFYLSLDEGFTTSEKVGASSVDKSGTFTYSRMLNNYDNKWYCKAYASNGHVEITSPVTSYTVKPFSTYVGVTTPEVISIIDGNAGLVFNVNFVEGVALSECGVCYDVDKGGLSIESGHISTDGSIGSHTVTIEGLKIGQEYFACSYARDGDNVTYSQACSFIPFVHVTGVELNEPAITIIEGNTYTLTATVYPSNATNKSLTWTSTDTSVATVDQSGKVSAKAVGSATIKVTTSDGGYTASCSVSVIAKTYPVTGVSLNKASTTITVGGSEILTATVYPSNATNKSLTWTSTNTSVATVDQSGKVSAKAVGSATIKVTTSDGGYTATCSVTVNPIHVTGVSLNKANTTITVGDFETLTATVSPSNATNKSLTWTSTNTSVATVDQSGKVSAKAVGSATIKVTTSDGGYTASCSVSVIAKTYPVTGVSLNKANTTITVGDFETLTATVSPSNATNKSLTWTSTNTSVATVDQSGKVSAKAVGSATIKVTTSDGGYTATCSVTVNPIHVTGVSLNKASTTITVGGSETLTATVYPSNATNKSLTWTSTDTSVATVDQSGKVSALKPGSATITVTTEDGGYTASCSVTVRPSDDADTEDLDKYDYEFGDAPDAVDLGLPSGLKWATCNLGASKPEEYGGYYQWAGTQDVTSTSIYLNSSNCPYHTGSSFLTGWTKYVPSGESSYWSGSGSPDNKTVLDPSDDVAHVKLGGKWRMPTLTEFDELYTNCTSEWTTLNGVKGRKFTSKKNGNSIFLPAAGFRYGGSFGDVGSYGYYWSSSLNTFNPDCAYSLGFNSGGVDPYNIFREDGHSVRPVSE